MKKLLLTMMLVVSCLFMGRTDVALASEETLNLNGTKITDSTTDEDREDTWKFTLNEAGYVTINVKSWMESYHYELFDSNMNSLFYEDRLFANENVKYRTDTITVHLTAGTYYLVISGYEYGERYFTAGRYELSGTTVNANETYKEPNDTFDKAPTVGFNSTVNGQIAYNDSHDIYKIVLTKSGELIYNMTSYMPWYTTIIYNELGDSVWYTDRNYYNEAVGYISKSHEIELAAGTYYIKVMGAEYDGSWADKCNGNYSFDLKFTDAQETCAEPNNDFKSAKQISIGQNVRGHLAVNDTEDTYKVTVSKKCRFSVDLTTYVGRCGIKISDSNGIELYDNDRVYWDETLGYKVTNHTYDLNSGTYYITVYAGDYGNYDLKASELVLLEDCDIKVDASVVCTGKEVTVPITIKYNGTTLKEGTDYIAEYGNNTNIGTNARVTITGIGKYAGSVEKNFSIVVKVGATAQNDEYKFKFLTDSTVVLSGLANTTINTVDVDSSVHIAGKWFKVTEVAEKAFYNNTKILSVRLPYTITKVGKNAFAGCTKMTKITFNSAPRIYADAFKNCGKLKTVEGLYKGTIITLGKNRYTVNGENTLEFTCLENSKDSSLTVPSTVKIGAATQKVTAIAAKAVDKTKIKQATIGKNVTVIGDKAFQKCASLTKVTFKGKNITMGAEVFDGCKKLKTVSGGTGSVLTIGKYKYQITGKSSVAVAGIKNSSTKSVSIGTTVKIGAKSYKITSVAKDAFRNTAVTSVTLGKNIKKIEEYAFYDCYSLKKVTFKGKNLTVGNNAFAYCGNLRTFKGATGSTFTYDVNKYKITSKSAVTFMGVTSNYGNSISIPDSITIGAKSYKITKIADKALRGKDMTSVSIGRNVTSIGKQAFEKCENLMNLYVYSTKIKSVGASAFKKVDSDIRVRVYYQKVNTYKKMFRKAGMPSTADYYNYY